MPGLMPTFDAMTDADQAAVREISNEARQSMYALGVAPRNDDAAAVFDEAVAVYLTTSREHTRKLHEQHERIQGEPVPHQRPIRDLVREHTIVTVKPKDGAQ